MRVTVGDSLLRQQTEAVEVFEMDLIVPLVIQAVAVSGEGEEMIARHGRRRPTVCNRYSKGWPANNKTQSVVREARMGLFGSSGFGDGMDGMGLSRRTMRILGHAPQSAWGESLEGGRSAIGAGLAGEEGEIM